MIGMLERQHELKHITCCDLLLHRWAWSRLELFMPQHLHVLPKSHPVAALNVDLMCVIHMSPIAQEIEAYDIEAYDIL